jgi:hypothetical protein
VGFVLGVALIAGAPFVETANVTRGFDVTHRVRETRVKCAVCVTSRVRTNRSAGSAIAHHARHFCVLRTDEISIDAITRGDHARRSERVATDDLDAARSTVEARRVENFSAGRFRRTLSTLST